jgi:hypothetical protein
VSIEPKQFQTATIEAALRTLIAKKGARRYLVADEVGLGKTIVASGIIQKLADKQTDLGGGPLNVLYVCSNLAIAKQNVMRLLSFLPEDERKSAVANVDRPSLLPTRPRPSHDRAHIYMLTPETAIPTRKGQRRDGRMEERALALVLLHRILAPPIKRLYRAFRRQAGNDSFSGWVHFYRGQDRLGKLGGREFRNGFRDALRDVLGLQPGQHLPPRLNQMLDEKKDQDLVGACRTALAVAALQGIGSGLVIFDEFQRFRDLMEDDGADDSREVCDDDVIRKRAAVRVLESIRGLPDGSGPALLLLSATPYTPYRRHSRQGKADSKSADQSSDFFDLVAFLSASSSVAEVAKGKFLELSEELRKGVLDSVRLQTIRNSLMGILLPLMSRTERPSLPDGQGTLAEVTSVIDADLLPSDISQFCDMQECFNPASQDWIVPLWQSVPLPMQTLGSRYLAWASKVKMPDRAALTKVGRDEHQLAAPWPHPRLRALMSKMTDKRLSMPWAAPSLPWWPLKGGWTVGKNDTTVDGKLLVFSRYKAVPTALSGLISYTTESRLLSIKRGQSKVNYEAASKRRWLQPSLDRPNLLELFHPSGLLAGLEPLVAPLGSQADMKREVKLQLRKRLKELGVAVVPEVRLARRKPWELLVAIEKKAGLWDTSRSAWETVAPVSEDNESVGRLRAMMEKWDKVAGEDVEISEISEETDLPALVALALESPAVVLLRALSRHWPDAACSENLPQILSLIWRGLRGYLDKSWFVSALGEGGGGKYPDAIRKAVIDGNFESVLDEHFWFLSTDGVGDWGVRLEEVEKSLRLRDASVTFHEGVGAGGANSNDTSSFSIRCHVAVPLAEGRKGRSGGDVPNAEAEANAEDSPLRPDEVRKAFNSPFWPNVLITTSIGQEGLDLHPWCNALAHWDLASSPVALEQREGRITRFGSLSVRRAIARKLGSQLESGQESSPWVRLASLAEDKLKDESGLSPWWVVEGGECQKFFLTVPGGEQQERYENLARERALYRLVLGMPDQADLIRLLDAQGKNPDALREVCIDLSAYNNQKRTHG